MYRRGLRFASHVDRDTQAVCYSKGKETRWLEIYREAHVPKITTALAPMLLHPGLSDEPKWGSSFDPGYPGLRDSFRPLHMAHNYARSLISARFLVQTRETWSQTFNQYQAWQSQLNTILEMTPPRIYQCHQAWAKFNPRACRDALTF